MPSITGFRASDIGQYGIGDLSWWTNPLGTSNWWDAPIPVGALYDVFAPWRDPPAHVGLPAIPEFAPAAAALPPEIDPETGAVAPADQPYTYDESVAEQETSVVDPDAVLPPELDPEEGPDPTSSAYFPGLPDWWVPGLPWPWPQGSAPSPTNLPPPEVGLPPLPPEFEWPEGLPAPPDAKLPPLPYPSGPVTPTPGPVGAPEPAPVPQQGTTAPPGTAGTSPPGVLSRVRGVLDIGLPLLGLLGSLTAGDYEEGDPPTLPGDFGGETLPPLPPVARYFQGLPDEESYYTYGQVGAPQSGEALFLAPAVNPFSTEVEDSPGGLGEAVGPLPGGPPPARLPPATFQRGGEVDYWEQNEDVFTIAPQVSAQGSYVKGEGSGRDDTIRAQLSAGEYVMDAETVALLGDGSGDEGARRLDEMRRNLRKHKAEKWSKGEFSHKAKNPDKYMGQLRRRAKTYEHGGVHNIGKGGRVI